MKLPIKRALTLRGARLVMSFMAAVLFAVCVGTFLPAPKVSLAFADGVSARVEQVFESQGGFHLEVEPKEAAARFTHLTIAGIPCFSHDWLVASCRTTEPLGTSAKVEFPRLFDLLQKLFKWGRIAIAVLPLVVLLCIGAVRVAGPFLRSMDSPRFFLLATAVLSVCALPQPVRAALPGLDESWMWFLNRFAFERVFGLDVVFTYGPLGFLLVPELDLAHALLALIANSVYFALFGFLACKIYAHSESGRIAAWLMLATLLFPQGSMEWRWVVLAVLYAAWPVFADLDERCCCSWFAVAGALLGMICFVKFSSLVAVAGTQAFSVCLMWRRLKQRGWIPVLSYGVAFFLAVTVFSFLCFSSLPALALWLKGSIATASGYNLHMVFEKFAWELALPFLVGSVFVWSAGIGNAFLFGPLLFCTAKYAWVRQSSSAMLYSMSVLAALCLVAVPMRRTRARVFFAGCLIVAIGLGLPGFLSGIADFQTVCGLDPRNALDTIFLSKTCDRASDRSRAALEGFRLCADWRNRIADERVAVFPVGYEPAMADPTLNVVPLPSLQLYSACHPYLDGLNADFFTLKTGPRYVVLGIEGCPDVINYPRTWMALLSNYKMVLANERHALLERCEAWRSPAAPFVRYNPAMSVRGRILATFFRNSVEYITITDGQGRRVRHRYVRGNQGVGYPLAWIPFKREDLQVILR